MKLTTYQKLKKYEGWLTTAHNGNYIRSLTNSQMDDLISIASEIGIIHVNNHCPKCALEFMKKLAIPYFEFQAKMESNKEEGENNSKKKGRKKNGNK